MQVDRGDKAIRDRVIFKALSVIDANVSLPTADTATLRKWFDAHRERYDEPARFDFQEAVLGGDASESAVRTFVTALNAGTPGDAKAGLRVYKARPHANIEQSFGASFAKALETTPLNAWVALSTRDGWRAIRVDAVTPPKPADFDVVRNTAQLDWADATAAEQRTAAVNALAKKYTVRIEAERR
jgi:PPIC-type PPIASE domain